MEKNGKSLRNRYVAIEMNKKKQNNNKKKKKDLLVDNDLDEYVLVKSIETQTDLVEMVDIELEF